MNVKEKPAFKFGSKRNLLKRKLFQKKTNNVSSLWQVDKKCQEGYDFSFWGKTGKGDSISYGLSSFGYDARVSDEFKIFTNVNSEIVDPKNFKPTNFVTKNVPECIIPPNSFVLARTVEKFKIPEDVLVICLGKSTYARCGIIVNVTPLEPGWEGYVTLEFSNTTPLPAKIYANEGVAQFIFLKGDEKPEITYADRKGKYMGQTE